MPDQRLPPNVPPPGGKSLGERPPRARTLPPAEPLAALPGQPDLALLGRLLREQEDARLGRASRPADDANDLTAPRAAELRAVVAELARRRCESLRLYEPLPEQQRFHASRAKTRLLRGSNRGGKTLPGAVEVARAVTGQDPHGKYPTHDGRCFVVGKDQKHIGQVMWRKLGRAGAFRIIRDRGTGCWRCFRPWDPEDEARKSESRPAPPLIPPRLVKEIGWENKKEGVPNVVRLHNGWELSFFSSLGKPPQGSDIDLFWLDEEIVDPEWFPEMAARVLDRRGCGVWSATPQAGTEQLYELHERAEQLAGDPDAPVQEFLIRLADNPHIHEQEKRELAANLSDEDRAVRIDGEFAVLGFKVYPTFSAYVHGVEPFPVPHDWTRYMVVDPGYQVCAVLFAAVPPPALPAPLGGDHVYLYDELYLRGCDATKFGEAVAGKAQGQQFQAFVIDYHYGLHTDVGSGKTIARQYSEALRAKDVASVSTGYDFLFGSDDLEAGVLAVLGLLRVRPDGTTKLRVFRGTMPNFEDEIKRYHRKRVNGQVIDKPDQRKNNHLMDCLRYLAMYDPRYVKPRPAAARAGAAVRAFRAKQKRQREKDGGNYVNLGPRANRV